MADVPQDFPPPYQQPPYQPPLPLIRRTPGVAAAFAGRATGPLILRTPMVDDDGTGQVGTVLNDDWKDELYNQIDDVIARVVSQITGVIAWQTATLRAAITTQQEEQMATQPPPMPTQPPPFPAMPTTGGVGLAVTKAELDARAGGIARTFQQAFNNVNTLRDFIRSVDPAALTAMGYSADEVTLLKNAIEDLAQFGNIWRGEEIGPPNKDFRYHVQRLWGLGAF
jgi:hypothetical protein